MTHEKILSEMSLEELWQYLHLRYVGDNDELYFRDNLSKNAAVAKEYERMKLDLWKRYEHDRDAYTAHKSDFINYYTKKGKQL